MVSLLRLVFLSSRGAGRRDREGNGLYRRRAINEAWRALSELSEVYHVMLDARDDIVAERVR
ncbi:MAG TPA: hypothetical protein EYG11_20595 [Candidatus Latescibacteria bacterium]|nr:hypothetical protein [Candidatus Latescibacterota bacterium]